MKKCCLVFLYLFIALNFVSIIAQPVPIQQATPAIKPVAKNSKITYKIIDAKNNTFGYDIYTDNKLTFHQPTIPGIEGNSGFKTKMDAEKVAKLVITKIKKNEMPPSISIPELKKLKVI